MGKIKDHSNYCPYPFTQVTTTPHGKWKLCCSSAEGYGFTSDFNENIDFKISEVSLQEYWNGDYLDWVRRNHIEGNPIKECASCKEYENVGVESYRNRAIKERGYLDEFTPNPISLDLKLGNTCNAACLFCDPTSSSMVFKEWKKLGWDKNVPFNTGLTGAVNNSIFDEDYSWPENPLFWNSLREVSSGLRNLKFTGGEPLINPYIMDFLKFLVEEGISKKMRLQVTTNGILIPKEFLKTVPYFNEVQINFSVDGVGKRNEYIRYPTIWSKWLKNIELIEDFMPKNVDLCLQHSYSYYSLFYLDELMDFIWEKKRFGFHQFKVNHPEIQRPELLDSNDKEFVLENSKNLINKLSQKVQSDRDQFILKEFMGIVSMVEGQEDHSLKKTELKQFLIKLDKSRGRRIADYMPLVADSLGINSSDYK